MRKKKLLAVLLMLAMVVSLLPATAFAANNTATTMRLAKAQGVVTVTNATGKKITKTTKMKLYNGYKLKTGAKSYAWISLDDTKVAKLDANSVVNVQKSGKNLTLYLSSGNLFFNVKDPLQKGETFSIKTSTMTTGIRGTSGCVRVINPRVSEIHLLTGRIEVFAEHPELDLTKSEVLTAGTMATSLIDQEAMELTGEQVEIIVKELQEHNVCGNCATEVAADPELQERIEAETDLDVEQIVEEAEEKLEEDEAAAEEEQAAIDQEVAEQVFPEVVDPYFEEEETDGGSSAADVVVPTGVDSWDALVDAITAFNNGTSDTVIELTGNVPSAREMEEGTNALAALPAITNTTNDLTLDLKNYTLALNEDPLINSGNLTITNLDGVIANLQDAWSGINPTVINESGATLILNDGAIVATGRYNAAVENNGTFIMNGGEIISGQIDYSVQSGTFTVTNADNYGVGVENTGTFTLGGGVIHVAETAVDNLDTFRMTGGRIEPLEYNNGADVITEMVAVENNGTFEMTGGYIQTAVNPLYAYDGAVVSRGGSVSLMGGEITVENVNGMVSTGNAFQGNGGDLTIGGSAVIRNTVELNHTDAVMSGGTINVRQGETGINQLSGTLKMTGGTIQVNETGATGISSAGDFEMLGGKVAVNNAATNAVGVSITGTFRMENAEIEANTGVGLELNTSDKVTLGAGASVTAYDEAKAVNLLTRETILLTRPVAAEITWQFTTGYTNPSEAEITEHLFGSAPAGGLTIDTEEETVNSGKYTYVDTFGQAADAAAFAAAIEAFNLGGADMSITLNRDIDTTGVTFEEIGVDGGSKTLVINLGGNTLTLAQTMVNNETLTIIGDGTVQVKADGISPVIENNGNVKWESGTLKVPANGVGIHSLNGASGTVDVSGGKIDATASGAVGIISADGSSTPITIRGNVVFQVGSCGVSTQEDPLTGQIMEIYTPDTAAAAVQANYTDVTMDGGTIHVNSGTGIYGTGNITFNDGVINVKAGGRGIDSQDGKVTMAGGVINVEDNALRYGRNTRGIYLSTTESTLTLNGGEINVNSTLTAADKLSGYNYYPPEGVFGGQTVSLKGGAITATGEFAVTINSDGVVDNGSGFGTDIKATTVEGLMLDKTFGGSCTYTQYGDYYVLKSESGSGGNPGVDPGTPDPEIPEVIAPEYPDEPGTITTVDDLIAAFNGAGTDPVTIRLGRDLNMYEEEEVDGVLTETDFDPLVVAEGANITLDLNEYTLRLQDPLENNGTLTITGGDNAQWDDTASIGDTGAIIPDILIENYGTLTWNTADMYVRPGQIGIYNYEGATVSVTDSQIWVDYDLADGTGYGIVYVNEADVTADDSLFTGEGIYKKNQAELLNELALMSLEPEKTEPEENENTEETGNAPAETGGEAA